MTKKSQKSFSLAIHGGAGENVDKIRALEKESKESMAHVLEEGRKILAAGGTALDTVTLCVKLLEDNPLFSAGYGAAANAEGEFELDAAIMDGKTLEAGSVAAVLNIRNPVDLARLVMEKTEHIMLSGIGAGDFAKAHDIAMVTPEYFKEAHEKVPHMIERNKKHGTVGAVARDINGNLAAATSTGGWDAKMPGRIGDSPIIGAGCFADNDSGAVSCTGIGEDFMRTVLAAHIGFLIERCGLSAIDAAQEAINYLVKKVNGDGGFILVDKDGAVAIAQSSKVMRTGWIENGGETHTTLQPKIRADRKR